MGQSKRNNKCVQVLLQDDQKSILDLTFVGQQRPNRRLARELTETKRSRNKCEKTVQYGEWGMRDVEYKKSASNDETYRRALLILKQSSCGGRREPRQVYRDGLDPLSLPSTYGGRDSSIVLDSRRPTRATGHTHTQTQKAGQPL